MESTRANGSRGTLVPAQRRELIAERLRVDGSVTVAALETTFGVSAMTARRDLQALEAEGRARRTHGGAVFPTLAHHEDSFRTRLGQNADAKARLAQAVLAHVDEDEALFVDCSTTAYQAVKALLQAGRGFTVLTNSIPVMELVAQADTAPNTTLIGLSGSLRKATRSFVGPLAVAAIRSHFADKAIFSVKGITADGAMTEADALEAEVKRHMIERAREALLLIDGSKFERPAINTVAGLDIVHTVLVADAAPEHLKHLRKAGHRIEEVR